MLTAYIPVSIEGLMDASRLTKLTHQVETTRKQIEEYHRFQQAMSELVDTNIKICDTKLTL